MTRSGSIFRRTAALWLLAAVAVLSAATPARAAWRDEDKAMVREVLARIFAVAHPPADYAWPPQLFFEDNNRINAAAFNNSDDPARVVPAIVVEYALMDKIIQGRPGLLAFVLGHETGHILRGHIVHVRADPKRGTEFLHATFTREQELEADRSGVELALAAGYPFSDCVEAMKVFVDLGMDYSAFVGRKVDHPSWKERLAKIDTEHGIYWNSLSSFHTGVDLLRFEQFPEAAVCFEDVVRQFPDCAEGWTNLGYARLMQYCDSLTTDDLRKLGIRQVVIGGFYERPKSLTVRGDAHLWEASRKALEQALKLQPDLALAQADLGVAWLVAPEGKNPTLAARYFRGALARADAERALRPSIQAAVMINAAVADVAGGDDDRAAERLVQAARLAHALTESNIAAQSAIGSAMLYNQAFQLAESPKAEQRRKAVAAFEDYFKTASPTSSWWPLAYERYQQVCVDAGVKPRRGRELWQAGATARRRPVSSVELTSGGRGMLSLGQPMPEAKLLLGASPVTLPVVRGTKLVAMVDADRGIAVIGIDTVLAISFMGPHAPAVEVRGADIGSQPVPVKIGMTLQQLETATGGHLPVTESLFAPGAEGEFLVYRDLHLAVRVDGGKIVELVVAMIPETVNPFSEKRSEP